MLFVSAEVDVEAVKGGEQLAKAEPLGELGEGVDVFGEAFAAVAALAVGAGDVGVGVVDITGEEHAVVDVGPIGAHLFTVFAHRVEVGDFIGAEDVVGIFGDLCFQGRHDGELFAFEDFSQKLNGAGEDHGLSLEVLDMRAFREEFGHVADLMAGFFGEPVGGAGKNGGAHKYRHVGEPHNELFHEGEILRAVVFCGHVNLQKCNVNGAEVIVIPFGRIADGDFALGVIFFQPNFEGSANEAAPNDANMNHRASLLSRTVSAPEPIAVAPHYTAFAAGVFTAAKKPPRGGLYPRRGDAGLCYNAPRSCRGCGLFSDGLHRAWSGLPIEK